MQKMDFGLVKCVCLNVCFVLLLGGTDKAIAQEHGPADACQVHEVARLSLNEVQGRFVTVVEINDHPMSFLIDTGSGGTLLTPRAAEALGLPLDRLHTVTISGFGAPQDVGHPRIARSIRLGPLTWHDYPVVAADFIDHAARADPSAPQGVLGADLLSTYEVDFDFPNRVMRLYQPSGCTGRWTPWIGIYQKWRPMRTAQSAFVIPVSVAEQPLFAEIDTGAQTTIVSREAAQSAGIDVSRLNEQAQEAAIVANGPSFKVRRYFFKSLRVGAVTLKDVVLYVGDTVFADADVLLGMDILRNTRIWLSYSSNQVFMQYTRGPAAMVIQKYFSDLPGNK